MKEDSVNINRSENPHRTPFFSIVLPAYGVEPYLPSALDDLVSQSFTDWEAIVVDDCSPDKSRQIAEYYAARDSRFRVVSHEVNQGLSAARNTGLKEAKGKYVWFPDPDDRFEKDTLQKVKDSLERQTAPVVLIGHVEDYYALPEAVSQSSKGDSCAQLSHSAELSNSAGMHAFKSEGAQLERSVDFSLNDKGCSREGLRELVLQLEKKTHYGYAWNKFYERSYLLEGDYRFTEDLPLIEDIEFNIRVFQNLPSLNIVGAPLYHYAKREGSNLTNKFVPRYFEVHRQRIQMLRDQQESWGFLTDDSKGILGGLFARYILSALERNCEPESNLNHSQRVSWCNQLFKDPLFQELIPCAQADSFILRVCVKVLQHNNASISVALGQMIHEAKHGLLHNLFVKIKASR